MNNKDGTHIANLIAQFLCKFPEVCTDDPEVFCVLKEIFISEPESNIQISHRCKAYENNRYCRECQQDGRYACFKKGD